MHGALGDGLFLDEIADALEMVAVVAHQGGEAPGGIRQVAVQIPPRCGSINCGFNVAWNTRWVVDGRGLCLSDSREEHLVKKLQDLRMVMKLAVIAGMFMVIVMLCGLLSIWGLYKTSQ
jgi:hypothetical protein